MAEGAPLEAGYPGNRVVGSNPTFSANILCSPVAFSYCKGYIYAKPSNTEPRPTFGRVAQSAERPLYKGRVAGSIPASPTSHLS